MIMIWKTVQINHQSEEIWKRRTYKSVRSLWSWFSGVTYVTGLQGVQRRMVLVVNCFEFLKFFMPPTLKKWGTYWFRLVRMYVCIHVRDIVLKLHVWIPHGKIADAYFWFSLNYLPLLNYGPLTNKGMKFCKCRISKIIIARNLKLVSADRGW